MNIKLYEPEGIGGFLLLILILLFLSIAWGSIDFLMDFLPVFTNRYWKELWGPLIIYCLF